MTNVIGIQKIENVKPDLDWLFNKHFFYKSFNTS